MTLTIIEIKEKYPEVHDFFFMQVTLPQQKYEEKMNFWIQNNINCFERWTVPYFIHRDREQRRPCLRLNHPPEGKCIECNRGSCRYEKICFLCGNENHGAYQTQQAGKYKGQLKCAKHRKLRQQIELIKLHHTITDEALYQLFASTYPPIMEPIDFTSYGMGNMGYNANAFMHHGNINGGFFTNNFAGFPPALPTPDAINNNMNNLSMGLASPTSNVLTSTNNTLPSFLNFDGFYAATNNNPTMPGAGDLLSPSTDMPPLQLLPTSPRSLLDHSRLNNAGSNTNVPTSVTTSVASNKASPNNTEKKYTGQTGGESSSSSSSSTFSFPSLYPGLLPSNPSNGLLTHTTTNDFKLSVEESGLSSSSNNNNNTSFHSSFPSMGAFMDRKDTPSTTSSNSLLSRDANELHLQEERMAKWSSDLFTGGGKSSPTTSNNLLDDPNTTSTFFPNKILLNVFTPTTTATTTTTSSPLTSGLGLLSSLSMHNTPLSATSHTPNTIQQQQQGHLPASASAAAAAASAASTSTSTSTSSILPSTTTTTAPVTTSTTTTTTTAETRENRTIKVYPILTPSSCSSTKKNNTQHPSEVELVFDYLNTSSYQATRKVHMPLQSLSTPHDDTAVVAAASATRLFRMDGYLSLLHVRTTPTLSMLGWSHTLTAQLPPHILQTEIQQVYTMSQQSPFLAKIVSPQSFHLSKATNSPRLSTSSELSAIFQDHEYTCLFSEPQGEIHAPTLETYIQELRQETFSSSSDVGSNNASSSSSCLSIGKLFSYEEIQTMFHQLLTGLVHCHEAGGVHGFIHPKNILIVSRGNVSWMNGFGPAQQYQIQYAPLYPPSIVKAYYQEVFPATATSSTSTSREDSKKSLWVDPSFHFSNTYSGTSSNTSSNTSPGTSSNTSIPTSSSSNATTTTSTTAAVPPSYDGIHDIWSLGLVYYYILCSGHDSTDTTGNHSNDDTTSTTTTTSNSSDPISSVAQLQRIVEHSADRMSWLNTANVYTSYPMLYDMLERMLRPHTGIHSTTNTSTTTSATSSSRLQQRATLSALTCHPFFWTIGQTKTILGRFMSSLMTGYTTGQDQPVHFVRQLNRICPLYVFGQGGWVDTMPAMYLSLIQQHEAKDEYWWSGYHLLLSIYHQVYTYPDTLMMIPDGSDERGENSPSVTDMVYRYLHEMFYVQYPKLLILLYELSSGCGQWMYDRTREEITFAWNE